MSATPLNNVTSNQYQNSDLPTSGKTIDEICCGFLDDLFPRAGGAIWKASVIFKLKVCKPHRSRRLRNRKSSSLNIIILRFTVLITHLQYRRLLSFA